MEAVILTILLSSLIGSITGIIIMVLKGKDFKYAIPFGPFLSLGAVIALFYRREHHSVVSICEQVIC